MSTRFHDVSILHEYMHGSLGTIFLFIISPKTDKKIDKKNKHDSMIWTHILKSDGVFRQRHARICQIYSDVLMLSKIILGRDFRLNSSQFYI